MDSENKSQSSTTSNQNEDKEIFNVLELPTVAENIFKYLPASDLATCAKTCRSWNILANSAKKKRRQIYMMSGLNEYQEMSFPSLMRKKFLNLWSEPNLAIAIGESDEYTDMAIAAHQFRQEHLEASEAVLSHWEKYYNRSIQEAERRNQLFRNELPRNCTFVNLNLPVHYSCRKDGSSSSIFTYDPHFILIPSIPGVEIQPFVIPPPGNTNFLDRKKIELLHVSSEKNVLSKDIKCVLVFAHRRERDIKKQTTYAETNIAKYISEETMIIGGHSVMCPISAGIAISGKNVRIECFYINHSSSCCVKQCFSVLKEIGLHNENGIAFALKEGFFHYSILHSLWAEYFPKTVLFSIHLDFGFITTTTPSKVSSFQPCNGCGKQSNISDPLDKTLALIFICFKDFNSQVIKV